MTCIVAMTDGSEIVMAGDSAGCGQGSFIELRDDPKVFERQGYLFGYTTSFRMGQILRYHVPLPEPADDDAYAFMVNAFIPAARAAFVEHGFDKTYSKSEAGDTGQWSEQGQRIGGRFVVGLKGQLFTIDHDYNVAKPHLPYAAVGRGAEIAYGSLFSTGALGMEERAELALRAAAQHTGCVRPPFVVVRG